jgi:hypothetical protein
MVAFTVDCLFSRERVGVKAAHKHTFDLTTDPLTIRGLQTQ